MEVIYSYMSLHCGLPSPVSSRVSGRQMAWSVFWNALDTNGVSTKRRRALARWPHAQGGTAVDPPALKHEYWPLWEAPIEWCPARC